MFNEVDSEVIIQFILSYRWKESEATFRNLKGETFRNTVSSEDTHKLWYPKVLFFNTRYKDTTSFGDKSVMTIERGGLPRGSSISEESRSWRADLSAR